MAELTSRDRAHTGYTLFLQRLPQGKATEVAKEMKVSDADISTMKNKEMERCIHLLAHLGLKVVDSSARCISPSAFAFLTETHERVIRSQPSLIWDEAD